MIYLDNASTTKPHKELINLYKKGLDEWFVNSDSLYPLGVQMSLMIEKSRKIISELFYVQPQDLIFTSSGSEANNLAIKGLAFANRKNGNHLITSAIEHPSVLSSMKQLRDMFNFELTIIEVDNNGQLDLESLSQSLRKDTILVSFMAINNEVGTIFPIEEIVRVVKAKSKALIHVDMVQLLGKHPLDLTGIDAASFSAHKINGFKGTGLLYCKHHLNILPLISGGQQEFGIRAGTANTINNVLLAKTVMIALKQQPMALEKVTKLNQYLRSELKKIDDIVINSPENGSPYIVSFSHLKLGSEIVMNALSQKEIYVSSRSTCSSKLNTVSHVLSAMSKNYEVLNGVIRVSMSHDTTKKELEILIAEIKEVNKHVISK